MEELKRSSNSFKLAQKQFREYKKEASILETSIWPYLIQRYNFLIEIQGPSRENLIELYNICNVGKYLHEFIDALRNFEIFSSLFENLREETILILNIVGGEDVNNIIEFEPEFTFLKNRLLSHKYNFNYFILNDDGTCDMETLIHSINCYENIKPLLKSIQKFYPPSKGASITEFRMWD